MARRAARVRAHIFLEVTSEELIHWSRRHLHLRLQRPAL